MIGTSRNDHMRIHMRFPVLALLLSICNPSTMVAGFSWSTDTPPENVLLKNDVQLDAYRGTRYISLVIHGTAIAVAGLAIWQAVLLGMRGVVPYACPTWYNPLIWLLIGSVVHIIDVVTSRLCIVGRDRWRWHLSAVGGIKVRWPWAMRLKDMALTVRRLFLQGPC
jgi:hypothetical protein